MPWFKARGVGGRLPAVSTELEVGNSGVSDNLRWIAYGPHPFVITYSGYAVNGCLYHTKSCEKDRSVQNSGVSLVAKTMQVSSSKDKNPVTGDIGGVWIDELGYILVDLNRVVHKSDSFILASQVKQVFYVEDPSDVRWSVVLTPPQRDFEDRYNDDELGDTILRCEGIPNDMPDVDLNNDWMTISQYDLNEELGVGELNATVEEIDTRNETLKELKRQREPTIMFDVTRIRSLGDKKVVRYNEDETRICENGAKLKSFIGSATHYHVPVTYTSWKSVPIELKDKIFTTVEDEISMNTDSSSVNRYYSTQALGTKEHNGRVRGVGGYVTPTAYFHSVKKTSKDEANILVENEELRRRVSELEAQIRSNLSTPLSAHGSCSRPIMLEGIEEKGKRIEVESLDKPKEN
ncbi:hypothetical protein E6C27_scaffold316G001260 [Cucumis melo var. makuwa]|uniref:DUF4216 domain-containing protein n=1 Tax=Cucumis melo var. makuwa TaxID=1194695 RepID=A0A5A7TU35_CUCMM|nr:hypothetical protein E6C27_scaffold316G001260 [Cucumis melo var. makuwa]